MQSRRRSLNKWVSEPGSRTSFCYIQIKKPVYGDRVEGRQNRQSVHQKEYEAEFGRIGAKYVVVRSIGEFMKVVNEYLNNV